MFAKDMFATVLHYTAGRSSRRECKTSSPWAVSFVEFILLILRSV